MFAYIFTCSGNTRHIIMFIRTCSSDRRDLVRWTRQTRIKYRRCNIIRQSLFSGSYFSLWYLIHPDGGGRGGWAPMSAAARDGSETASSFIKTHSRERRIAPLFHRKLLASTHTHTQKNTHACITMRVAKS